VVNHRPNREIRRLETGSTHTFQGTAISVISDASVISGVDFDFFTLCLCASVVNHGPYRGIGRLETGSTHTFQGTAISVISDASVISGVDFDFPFLLRVSVPPW
jgi:hypothetical protein